MAKKKGTNDAGKTAPRRYYDPATRPYPRHSEPSANPGPVGNSRQQRRARARLSLADQWLLAKAQGFEVPTDSREILTVAGADYWIARWEKSYARR